MVRSPVISNSPDDAALENLINGRPGGEIYHWRLGDLVINRNVKSAKTLERIL
jgi:hypothetical protein